MNDFASKVYTFVHQIPSGSVATYGDIAKLAGMSTYSRHVGKILSRLPNDSALPWHRIINGKGEISLKGDRGLYQMQLLREEGIEFSDSGRVKLAKHRITV